VSVQIHHVSGSSAPTGPTRSSAVTPVRIARRCGDVDRESTKNGKGFLRDGPVDDQTSARIKALAQEVEYSTFWGGDSDTRKVMRSVT
jgi:hypothetical protein